MADGPDDPEVRGNASPSPEPDETGADAAADPAESVDKVWEQIIANYGERAEIEPEPTPVPRTYPRAQADQETGPAAWEQEEHFSPPTPPPAPSPFSPRGLAWLGVIGAPVVTLFLLMISVHPPSWAALLLFFAFVGGIGYLVATMPRGGDDDDYFGDDGAVV